MRTAEQWTMLYEDGGSELNSPAQRHITEIIRAVQREAFDYGALAMKMASGEKVSGLNRAALATIDIRQLKGRP